MGNFTEMNQLKACFRMPQLISLSAFALGSLSCDNFGFDLGTNYRIETKHTYSRLNPLLLHGRLPKSSIVPP
jgi:hypothetical protein